MASLALGIGAASSLIGGAIQSNAAGNAASAINNAAQQNAELYGNAGKQGIGYEQGQLADTANNLNPYIESGKSSLSTLNYLLGNGGDTSGAFTGAGARGSLLAPYAGGGFAAPTAAQAAASPGEQFQLQQGLGAMQAGAAANGSLLTGGTEAALNNYAQNVASTNYNNIYNQALQSYNTNYNTWANQQANTYNRLTGQAGMGMNAANSLGNFGANAANNEAQIGMNTAAGQAGQYNMGANAIAQGDIGSANAWSGALNNVGQLGMMGAMMNPKGGMGTWSGGSQSNLQNSMAPLTNSGYGSNGAMTLGGVA